MSGVVIKMFQWKEWLSDPRHVTVFKKKSRPKNQRYESRGNVTV